MIIAFQVVLAISLLFLAAMLFMAVRQIGILSRRIPRTEELEDLKPHSLIGEKVPAFEFMDSAREWPLALPFDGSGNSFLLFTSFTCSICHPMLERLHQLAGTLRQKTLLMVLSENPREVFSREIHEFQLGDFHITDATSMAESFKLRHAPALYVVDAQGTIKEVLQIWSFADLQEHLTRITTQSPYEPDQVKSMAAIQPVQAVTV